MPGPYTDILSDNFDVLAHVGGYAHTDPQGAGPEGTHLNAEMYNKAMGAIIDMARRLGSNGFVVGSGRTFAERRANLARLQAIIAADPASVRLPRGTIEVELLSSDINSTVLGNIVCMKELTGTVNIVGAGKTATTLDMYPKDLNSVLYSGFIVNGATVQANVTMEGFTLAGPTTFVNTSQSVCEGVGFYGSGAASHVNMVKLASVSITGRWNTAANITAAGKKWVDLLDFYGEGSIPVQCYYDTPTTVGGTRLHMTGAHLRSFTMPLGLNNYNVYVHPSVSLRCVNSRFEDANGTVGYAIHIFGSPGHLPEYCEFIGCHFVNGNRGVLCNKLIPTRFANCTFLVAGAALVPQAAGTQKGMPILENCRITLQGGSGDFGGGVIGGIFTDCHFEDGGSSNGNFDLSGGAWKFKGCTFDKSGTGAFHLGASSGAEVEVESCEFLSTSASYAVVPATGGRVRFRDCVFGANVRGSYGGASASDCDFDGCHFKNAQAVRFSANNPSGQIRGRNNWFDSTTWTDDAGSTGWCDIHPREAANPSTVASAASVTLSPNYNQHHVTGTTTIQNLYTLDSTRVLILFGGTHYLIADGAWAFSAAGNIVPDHTNARTVGEMIPVRYDPTAAKWRVAK